MWFKWAQTPSAHVTIQEITFGRSGQIALMVLVSFASRICTEISTQKYYKNYSPWLTFKVKSVQRRFKAKMKKYIIDKLKEDFPPNSSSYVSHVLCVLFFCSLSCCATLKHRHDKPRICKLNIFRCSVVNLSLSYYHRSFYFSKQFLTL